MLKDLPDFDHVCTEWAETLRMMMENKKLLVVLQTRQFALFARLLNNAVCYPCIFDRLFVAQGQRTFRYCLADQLNQITHKPNYSLCGLSRDPRPHIYRCGSLTSILWEGGTMSAAHTEGTSEKPNISCRVLRPLTL